MFGLKTRGNCTSFDQRHIFCRWSTSLVGLREGNIRSRQGFFTYFCHGVDLWPRNFVQSYCTPFNQRHSVETKRKKICSRQVISDGRKDRPITTGYLDNWVLRFLSARRRGYCHCIFINHVYCQLCCQRNDRIFISSALNTKNLQFTARKNLP